MRFILRRLGFYLIAFFAAVTINFFVTTTYSRRPGGCYHRTTGRVADTGTT